MDQAAILLRAAKQVVEAVGYGHGIGGIGLGNLHIGNGGSMEWSFSALFVCVAALHH
jgi:hypothetical protein